MERNWALFSIWQWIFAEETGTLWRKTVEKDMEISGGLDPREVKRGEL